MSLKEKIKQNKQLKAFALFMLMPRNEHRPRLWVRWFWNSWKHKRGKGALVRWNTRLDVLPFNKFDIGTKTVIEDYVTVNNGIGDVVIGDRTLVGISCVVIGPVTMGNDIMLAQHVVMSGLNHGYQDINLPISEQPCTTAEIVIEDEAWIGANSVITAGVRIGKHSIVAAGSVVTKNVPPYSIFGGNPAKMLKQYNFETKEWEKVSSQLKI